MATPSNNISNFRLINHMSVGERKKFLDSFDLVFCDCDGVLWETLGNAIPGSGEAIAYLRSKGKEVKFVTNNSIFSIDDHLRKFEKFRLEVEKKDIIHPAQTICDHLKSLNFNGLIYCLATAPFKKLLTEAGFHLLNEREGVIIETLQDLHEAIKWMPNIKAIVIDVDFNLNAAKLMRAHVQLVKDPTCLFIAGAADPVIPFIGGNLFGPGAFIDILAESTKRTPLVLGKPGQALRDLLHTRYAPLPPQRVLFIGDSMLSDICFARMCGYQTLLVLTGGTRAKDLPAIRTSREQPDYVANCLGDLKDIV